MNFATKTELLPHQVDAVNKVLPSRIGALFMEMGTGKSRTAIELVSRRLAKIDRAIWLCPVSLKETVRQEIKKHTDCNDTDIYVFDDKTTDANLPPAFWYVAGIESMSACTRVILALNALITENTFCILDESSYIKGYHALRTERITKICERARYRLILTGTPLSQGVVDLFAQMRFLSPKILGYNSFYSFAANHLEYSEKFPGMIVQAHNVGLLAAKIKPYIYQVTKTECLTLPSKTYETRYFSMTAEQREWYQHIKDRVFDELDEAQDSELSSIAIFRLFSSLQQVVSGFWNERMDKIVRGKLQKDKQFMLRTFDHGRIDTLIDAIQGIPGSEKVIIFCKFQYDIDGIRRAVTDACGVNSCAIFCGKLSEQERTKQIAAFRGPARFLIANQASGGHGLTLNEASHVIFYNNGFKYSERLQAEDRCHRIGQARPVTYIDIQCVHSIDERICEALAKKQNAVKQFKDEVDKVKKDKLKELIKSL